MKMPKSRLQAGPTGSGTKFASRTIERDLLAVRSRCNRLYNTRKLTRNADAWEYQYSTNPT
jgi:hypothetical protein